MINLIAAALVAAAPAPTAPDAHHDQMQHHAKGDCCCEHMAKADAKDCCADHGDSKSGEHAGHSAQ